MPEVEDWRRGVSTGLPSALLQFLAQKMADFGHDLHSDFHLKGLRLFVGKMTEVALALAKLRSARPHPNHS